MARSGKSLRGFTLIELMIVVGILGYLIALFMPVLSAAKQSALKTQCSSNLRQIGVAIQLYADANRGWIPRDATLGRPDREPWPLLLGAYLGHERQVDAEQLPNMKVLQCPAHPLIDIPTGYVVNAFAFETEADGWKPDGPIKITTIASAHELPWFFDAANNFPLRDLGQPDKIYGIEFHDVYSPLHMPREERNRISDDRHYKDVANVLYLDSHVSTIRKNELKLEMLDDKVRLRATTMPVTMQQ